MLACCLEEKLTKLDSILKSRDNTLLAKVRIAKPMVFPVVMYRCASWAIKKTEYQRIDVFKLWFWRRLEIPLVCEEIKPKENQLPEGTLQDSECCVSLFVPHAAQYINPFMHSPVLPRGIIAIIHSDFFSNSEPLLGRLLRGLFLNVPSLKELL